MFNDKILAGTYTARASCNMTRQNTIAKQNALFVMKNFSSYSANSVHSNVACEEKTIYMWSQIALSCKTMKKQPKKSDFDLLTWWEKDWQSNDDDDDCIFMFNYICIIYIYIIYIVWILFIEYIFVFVSKHCFRQDSGWESVVWKSKATLWKHSFDHSEIQFHKVEGHILHVAERGIDGDSLETSQWKCKLNVIETKIIKLTGLFFVRRRRVHGIQNETRITWNGETRSSQSGHGQLSIPSAHTIA